MKSPAQRAVKAGVSDKTTDSPDLRSALLAAQEELLAQGELAEQRTAELYEALALQFFEEKKFWLERAQEEREHVALVRTLRQTFRLDRQLLDFNETARAGLAALDALLRATQQRVSDRSLTHAEALQNAVAVEAALLDQGFFNLLQGRGKNPLFQRVTRRLRADTQRHYQIMAAALQSCLTTERVRNKGGEKGAKG